MSETFKFNSGENSKALKSIPFSTILQDLDQYVVTEVTTATSDQTNVVQNIESANSKMTEEDYFASYTPSTSIPQHPEDIDSHGA
jgi:hypothetical protein